MKLLTTIAAVLHIGAAILKLLVGYKSSRTIWLYKVDPKEQPINMTLPYSRGLAVAVLQELGLYDDNYAELIQYHPEGFTAVAVASVNGFENKACKGIIPIPTSIYDELVNCSGYDVIYNLDVSPPVEVAIFLNETKDDADEAADKWSNHMLEQSLKQNNGGSYGQMQCV